MDRRVMTIEFARLGPREQEVYLRVLGTGRVRFEGQSDGSITTTLRVVNPPIQDTPTVDKLQSSRPSTERRQELQPAKSLSPIRQKSNRTSSLHELGTTSSTALAAEETPTLHSDLKRPAKVALKPSSPPPLPKSFVFSPSLIPLAQSLHLDSSTLRGKLLPAKETHRIIEEIYLSWWRLRKDSQDLQSTVVQYFTEKCRGKKTTLEQRAGDFLYTLSVGKAARTYETKAFLRFLMNKWTRAQFDWLQNTIARVEVVTQERLAISTPYTEFLGDSVSVSRSDLYLTKKQCAAVLSALTLTRGVRNSLLEQVKDEIACAKFLLRLTEVSSSLL